MLMVICNAVAAVFAIMVSQPLSTQLLYDIMTPHLLDVFKQNLGQQLLRISRMETIYFDSEGRGAYRKKR